MTRFSGEYPPDWPAIAWRVKDEACWRCVRCGHPHEPMAGYTLTVHHLDGDKGNCAWWNIPALCQRCHLKIQGKVIMDRQWILPHSEWFKPYVAGYYASVHGLPTDSKYVLAHVDELVALGQGTLRDELESAWPQLPEHLEGIYRFLEECGPPAGEAKIPE